MSVVQQSLDPRSILRKANAIFGFYDAQVVGQIATHEIARLEAQNYPPIAAYHEGVLRAALQSLVPLQKLSEKRYMLPPGKYKLLVVAGDKPIVFRVDTNQLIHVQANRPHINSWATYKMGDGDNLFLWTTDDLSATPSTEGYEPVEDLLVDHDIGVVPAQMQHTIFEFSNSYVMPVSP